MTPPWQTGRWAGSSMSPIHPRRRWVEAGRTSRRLALVAAACLAAAVLSRSWPETPVLVLAAVVSAGLGWAWSTSTDGPLRWRAETVTAVDPLAVEPARAVDPVAAAKLAAKLAAEGIDTTGDPEFVPAIAAVLTAAGRPPVDPEGQRTWIRAIEDGMFEHGYRTTTEDVARLARAVGVKAVAA